MLLWKTSITLLTSLLDYEPLELPCKVITQNHHSLREEKKKKLENMNTYISTKRFSLTKML